MLVSWYHSLQCENDDFFVNQVNKLFKDASLHESVNVPSERRWAFLIYTYDDNDSRPYPNESDYAATCSLGYNNGKVFILFRSL